jgi:hypothetical protein
VDLRTLWGEQGWVVRLLLLAQLGLFLISLLRFAKLFRWLYVYPRGLISPRQVASGAADALYALSHRAPREPADPAKPLRLAESEFLHLCEKCSIDVESTKRAGWLVFLLALTAIAFRASMLGRVDCVSVLSFCLLNEVVGMSQLLSVGLLVSAIIYFWSGFFERKLSKRKNDWKYFFARSRNQTAPANPIVDQTDAF